MSIPEAMAGHPAKVIIVGATSGIGKELALLYASKHYKVVVTGRRHDLLIALQEKFPDNLVVESFDVTGKQNSLHLQNCINRLGGLELLIYSSGYGEISIYPDWNIDKQTINVNVNGFTEIADFAFNYFCAKGSGHFVCISSVASIRGNPRATAYNASKAFQSNYMEGLYLKAKKLHTDISITDVQPGFVNTAMAKGDRKFWMASPAKAAQQIYNGILHKKRKVYVTRRWWLIAVLLKYLPHFMYKKMT